MPMMPQDYDRLVTQDMTTYVGLTQPVKASLMERLFHRRAVIKNVHPNPDDEFSDPNIGPNFEIVEQYERQMRWAVGQRRNPMESRLCVEKMSVGGYMLLDGHHRWLAAQRTGLKTVPIHIMNVTPVADIHSKVLASTRRMCVSFDLDEVLLADGKNVPADRNLPRFHSLYTKKKLRLNSPELIRVLQDMGCDVWVYSGRYISEQEINLLFNMYNVNIDGIVNGLKDSPERRKLREAFMKKYDVSLHIDTKNIVWVNTNTGEYGTVAIGATPTQWSAMTVNAVRELDVVKACLAGEHQDA